MAWLKTFAECLHIFCCNVRLGTGPFRSARRIFRATSGTTGSIGVYSCWRIRLFRPGVLSSSSVNSAITRPTPRVGIPRRNACRISSATSGLRSSNRPIHRGRKDRRRRCGYGSSQHCQCSQLPISPVTQPLLVVSASPHGPPQWLDMRAEFFLHLLPNAQV